MQTIDTVKSQFGAAFDMFEQTIQRCPDEIWYDDAPTNRFWHVAYHTLFYVHLYLQPSEQSFQPWEFHRENYQRFGSPPSDSGKDLIIDQPYHKAEILSYLEHCRNELAVLDAQPLDGPSGFSWLPFDKLELQFYNIRHVQQHIGELSGRLLDAGIEIDWVGMHPRPV
jgi:hypothetical protein